MSDRFDLGEWDGLAWAEVAEVDRLLQRRRWSAWMAAALASLLLHGLLWWRFPELFLGSFLPERPLRQWPPFQIERVEVETPDLASTAGRFGSRPEESPLDVAAALSFHARGMDESKLVMPPPPAVRIGTAEWSPGAEGETTAASLRDQLLTRSDSWPVIPEEGPRLSLPAPTLSAPPPDLLLPQPEFPPVALETTGAFYRTSRELTEILDRTSPPPIPFDTSAWSQLDQVLQALPGNTTNPASILGGIGPLIPVQETIEEARLAPSGPPMTPIENRLRAELRVWHDRREPEFIYTRVEIQRAGPEVLPVLEKDILLIQDTSGSITEERLEYCRQGLLRILVQLRSGDRINLLQFKERPQFCFPDWAPVEPATLEKARRFILSLQSKGLTDIGASLAALSSVTVRPDRPAIAILVTDGLPTAGERDSAEILSQFTHRNAGVLSVFVLAVHDQANMYLLDLLSYMNRGDTVAARRGRWMIPETMERLLVSVSRPVLTGMELRFAGSRVECFPIRSPNLYLDRPLVFYGRYPVEEQRVVFQVAGRSGDQLYDMVFDLPVATAQKGDESIRDEWAWHKIYTLIGQHAITRDPTVLEALHENARRYGLSVPYAERLTRPSTP